jgi:hypothetical protein
MILIANKIKGKEYVYIQDMDIPSGIDPMQVANRLRSELKVNVHICELRRHITAVRFYKETGEFKTVTLRSFDTKVGRMFHVLGTKEVYPIYVMGDVVIKTEDGVIASHDLKKELTLE